ncbi:hypothetical protein TNCV_903771 [Trichonephila clavipes]|nr:hypothetical protein TNCV_903771 [Trichonephila clavipes]
MELKGRKYSPAPCTRDSTHKTFGPTDLTSTYSVCTRRAFGGIGDRNKAFRSGVRWVTSLYSGLTLYHKLKKIARDILEKSLGTSAVQIECVSTPLHDGSSVALGLELMTHKPQIYDHDHYATTSTIFLLKYVNKINQDALDDSGSVARIRKETMSRDPVPHSLGFCF